MTGDSRLAEGSADAIDHVDCGTPPMTVPRWFLRLPGSTIDGAPGE